MCKGKPYYAHTLEGAQPEQWQKLEDHLQAVAKLAGTFAEEFVSGDWARDAGWLHDLGKATNAFQGYLARSSSLDDSAYDADGSQPNHASTGAALAEERFEMCAGRVLAYLSAGHHAGLPDWYTAESGNAALPVRLKEGRNNLAHVRDFAEKISSKLYPVTQPPDCINESRHFHLWIRLLFSCLVDADRLNTEHFVRPWQTNKRGRYPSLEALAKKFFPYLGKKERDADKSPVNTVRAEVRQACEQASELPRGLFLLTVPTGGGKTLSAMAFALRHALKHGQRRVIYVIPYTSIIEQTAQVFKEIFGAENVIEHHSNLDPERESWRSQLAAENWDAPIIVTTNVQFFESLYAAKSNRCRKLHNIVNSVVILDEAQLLPPKLLVPCVDAINQLAANYGVTLVVMTATQPALPLLDTTTEIISPGQNLYGRLERVQYDFPPNLSVTSSWEEIAERLQQHEQVLCVVNTRHDCYDLFQLMPGGTIHLSTLMCGEHRSSVIDQIKLQLKDGLPIRVVSTQLVEAGVDIDFPVVYRALAGLDSIAQAAGRCNREGKLGGVTGRLGQVHVFVPPKAAPAGLLLKGENRTRELYTLPKFDLHCPEIFTRYFKLFYAAVNDTGGNWLRSRLVRDVQPNLLLQFRTAGQEFRLIDDPRRPVFVRYGANGDWLDKLQQEGPDWKTMRSLQRYLVGIPERAFDQALADGLVTEIYPEYWCWAGDYSPSIGVDIFGNG